MLVHDALEEVFKAWDGRLWDRGLLGGLVGSRLVGSGLVGSGLVGSGRLGVAQAAVVVDLWVAVGVRQDYAVPGDLRCRNAGWRSEFAAGGVEGMAEGLGRSLDVGLGLGAVLQGGAVFVVVHKAVVAVLGPATDAELGADLVDRSIDLWFLV